MNTLITLFLAALLNPLNYCTGQASPIEVTVTGTGAPILLLSGFATSGDAVWEETVKHLSKDYECHVINYAGFAGQETIGFPWLPKVLTAIETYMLQNQLESPVVIGHSLGGTLGIKLASNKKLDISKLLIIDALPATGALMFPDFKPENLVYESPYNQQMLQMGPEAFSQMAKNMAGALTSNKEGQLQIMQWMIDSDLTTYVYGYTDYLKFDVREDLRKISIPVTILGAGLPYGEQMARANYEKQYENLKEYNLKMKADSAHFIMMDQPGWFLQELKEFLK